MIKETSYKVYSGLTTEDSIRSLTKARQIFQKQLPKMPKEYITRVLYSSEHETLSIYSSDSIMLGAVTYRIFLEQMFAEIVFCAVDIDQQVKGYGTILMSYLKEYLKKQYQNKVRFLLTYADNYAIGYFKKQGFTLNITFKKEYWVGYIKDYDGGTLMQCRILKSINYLDQKYQIEKDKDFVQNTIKGFKKALPMYPGLLGCRNKRKSIGIIKPSDIPGLKEAGWLDEMGFGGNKDEDHIKKNLYRILTALKQHPSSWPFLKPITEKDVPGYLDIIKNPIDLETIEKKLNSNDYGLEFFTNDIQKMIENCREYNIKTSPYCKCANVLEAFFISQIR
eukprot:GHVP01048176.1.p1 GENE.GHVP01048176.1~~GHVP01048176.1.p1  ORF type:complete len:336 (+),score=66.09 GHVP01048176.1:2-1009(+)